MLKNHGNIVTRIDSAAEKILRNMCNVLYEDYKKKFHELKWSL